MSDDVELDTDGAVGAGTSERLLAIDAWFEGRRGRVIAALALFEALLAPMLDKSVQDIGRVRALRDTARAIGHAEMGQFEFFSLMGVLALAVVGGVLVAARVAALRAPSSRDEQMESLTAGLSSARRLLYTEFRLLWRKSGTERTALIGLLVFSGARAVTSLFAFGRYVAWKALVVPLGQEEGAVGRALEALYHFEGLISMVGFGGLVLTIVGLGVWAVRRDLPAEGEDGSVRDLRFLKASHPFVPAEDTHRHAFVAQGFNGGLVEHWFAAVAEWEPPAGARWEFEIRDDLADFLRDRGFDVRIEFNLGRDMGFRRIDLVIGGQIAVELKFELGRVTEADRATTQIQQYAAYWRGRGPVVVLVVFPDAARIRFMVQRMSAWNAEVQAPNAPVLVMTRGGPPDLGV